MIVTQFIHDVDKNEQTTCESNRKPEEIDEGRELVLHQIPDRDFEIVFHERAFSFQLSAFVQQIFADG